MVRRMRVPRLFGVCLLAVLSGCVKATPPPNPSPPKPDAGVTEAELIAPKLDAIEKEVTEVVQRTDESLWRYWTLGVPLDAATFTKGHEALLSKDTLDLLARARTLRPGDATRTDALSRWVAGELLVRGVAAESEALANLEAATTFQLDGKELPFRDLGKLLLSEKSALKRKALWAASHEAALRVDAAVARREAQLAEVLTSLGLPGPLEFAARSRGVDLVALEQEAEETLATTEAEWKRALQAMSDVEVKLPLSGLSRADLPRVLKVPASLDAEFPKQKIATRLVQTLAMVGLYGKPGLTLDLAEAAKKNPLPLTVTPARGEVRMSLRPLGGVRDQQLALAELGTAVALHSARERPLYEGRLASPVIAQSSAERFSALLSSAAWLNANEVKDVDAVIAQAKAQRLFALRRAAGLVLVRIAASRAADEAQSRGAFVAVMSRAMSLTLAQEEGARWRIETDDFLRNATLLQAMRLAEQQGPPSLTP
jgi:hypothetical protein